MARPDFQEIEYKFLVGPSFDLGALRRRLTALRPERTAEVAVRDTYYLVAGRPGFVYRHRYDEGLQHLSVKSLTDDSTIRLEVNLDLGHHRGDQGAAVGAFLETLDVVWRGEIRKEIEVFYFADCEAVYYRAWTDERELCCVELEATAGTDPEEAFAVLDRYVLKAGLGSFAREKKSLVELLYPDVFRRIDHHRE